MSAPDDDPMHVQLSRLCSVIDRLVRVVVRIDERRRLEAAGRPERRCDGCQVVTLEWECPCCGARTVAL